MKSRHNWEKASAIATVLTLISSTFLGAYGVYLGQRSISQSARIESAKIQPLLQFASRHGPVEEIIFENIGFGPAIIEGLVIGRKMGSSDFLTLRYNEETTYTNVEDFFKVREHNKRFDEFAPVLMGIHPSGAVYAPGQDGVIFTVSDVFARDQEWKNEFRHHFQKLVEQTMACVWYRSIDDVSHQASYNDGCIHLKKPS